MNTVLAVSLFVLLALASQAQAAQKEGMCGLNSWHKWSSCKDRQDRGEELNKSPIICFNDFPGYTPRSRHCVESFLCADPTCNKATGDEDTCYRRIVTECRSLGLYNKPRQP